ncbi:MAG TPA: hypothetical protein VHX61_11035 [Rhizomicrobium sp.]|jgi:hypothetical protein|nr:hypothetical protein [Rhizomicrobium sp.]
MKINHYLAASVSVLAVATMASAASGAPAHKIYLPYHWGTTAPKPVMPRAHAYRAPYVAPKASASGTWTDVGGVPFSGEGGSAPLVLTDGTVMIKQAFTGSAGVWYKLTPDSKGNYTDGTWTKLAAMPSGYSPDFFAEQVLTDGRVLIEGGEYNDNNSAWTNKGALYDPVANSWTSVSPPSGWSTIGDAQSIILPNGTYMLANCCDDPGKQGLASISGTSVTWTQGNSYSYNDEQGYTSLPDGNVLMVDVWNHGSTYDDYEIYNTSTGTWSLAGETANYLSSTSTYELGAAPLTPQYGTDGTVIQFTANGNPGVNDIYDVASSTWTAGPVTKVGSTVYYYADAPSATLPDGNVLTEGSPGYGSTPAHFWEFNISATGTVTATQVNDTNESPHSSNFCGNLIPLPTGQMLWDDSQYSTEVSVYTPQGSPNSSWLPVVSSVASTLTIGSTGNAISGTNFNGFDLGGSYGDDAQAATNFPLVRITNNSSGNVCFARSYNFSTMGVWTSGTTNATFDIPSTCGSGASMLQVVANGIASAGVAVTLQGQQIHCIDNGKICIANH